ncbi:MAG: ATP synthase F1 subunit delta [Pirellulaceae bacterium]|jgi:F-type H+-transporting ATPase subunit delta|nr:ATP synthase F1 subunit delta [Pirellulaceae bacterium]
MAKTRPNAASLDTGRQRIGTVYAKALLGAAEKAGQADSVVDELGTIVSEALDQSPDLDEVLRTPRIASEEKVGIVERVFGGRVSPLVLNFLKVLAGHERLDCLRAIERAARLQLHQLRNRVEVLVETASPLSAPLRQQVAARLTQLLGREVILSTEVNPDLLGGIVVRVGDTVYDGSLAGKLKSMESVTLERTTNTIRQSLARFALT